MFAPSQFNIMQPDNFHVKLTLRLDWSEMDLFGHVNNVMFFKYIQASRVNYWETTGISELYEQTGTGPILASAACQFRQPLHYPGTIVVQARADFIKNTSFGLHHRILNEKGEIAAEAQDVIVMFDFAKNKKVPFPQHLREAISRLENRAL